MTINPTTGKPKMLWHKLRINAELTEAENNPSAVARSKIEEEHIVRVAMIDTGVFHRHPFLVDRIDLANSIDFVSHPYGLLGGGSRPSEESRIAGKKYEIVKETVEDLGLDDEHKRLVQDIVKEFNESQVNGQPGGSTADLSDQFPSHGTACAGLIAGKSPPRQGTKSNFTSQMLLAGVYEGIAPDCQIVPIRTSMAPAPEPMILALLYCLQKKFDIIHLPRGISDRWRLETESADKKYDEYIVWKRTRDLGMALEAVLLAVSRVIPIFCAAGNSAEARLAYPSNLSYEAPDSTAMKNGIISVGAVSYRGYRSSYSNYGEGLTLVAPSDDGEIFNRHQVRIDEKSLQYSLHDYKVYRTDKNSIPYSREGILTLDIPGSAGFTGNGAFDFNDQNPAAKWFDPLGGKFTLFGGTSAASAIAAGAGALIIAEAKRLGKKVPDGIKLKEILTASCWLDKPPAGIDPPIDDVTNEEFALKLNQDNINGGTVPALSDLFGSGMIDVKAALLEVATLPPKESP